MRLNKTQREQIRNKFGGRCAYCGGVLADRFHVDHLEAVGRMMNYVRGYGFKRTGALMKPENDTLENMMPACPACNIDKHAMPLEAWRHKLERSIEVLQRNSTTYRHALRFAQVVETRRPVVFFFEQVRI